MNKESHWLYVSAAKLLEYYSSNVDMQNASFSKTFTGYPIITGYQNEKSIKPPLLKFSWEICEFFKTAEAVI